MKILVLLLCAGAAFAVPVLREKIKQVPTQFEKISSIASDDFTTTTKAPRIKEFIPIIKSDSSVDGVGGDFKYSYESGDGTKASQQGQLKKIDEERAGEAVVGEFSYKDKQGKSFSLEYTADENGYRPRGDHLPTPPPIPPAIARALAYLATKPTTTDRALQEAITPPVNQVTTSKKIKSNV